MTEFLTAEPVAQTFARLIAIYLYMPSFFLAPDP
jgi:hypothetical protein